MINLQKQIRICTVVIKSVKILTKIGNIFNRLFYFIVHIFERIGKCYKRKREVRE